MAAMGWDCTILLEAPSITIAGKLAVNGGGGGGTHHVLGSYASLIEHMRRAASHRSRPMATGVIAAWRICS